MHWSNCSLALSYQYLHSQKHVVLWYDKCSVDVIYISQITVAIYSVQSMLFALLNVQTCGRLKVMLIWLKLHPNQIEKPTQDESWTFFNISEKLGQYYASHWLGASLESALCIIRPCDTRWCHRTSGLVLGCWDFKSHFHEILKFFHNWPEKQHKMGLDTSTVSIPLTCTLFQVLFY